MSNNKMVIMVVVYQTDSTNSILPLSVLSFLFVTFLAINVISIFQAQMPQSTSLSLSTATAQTDQNVIDSHKRVLRMALLTDALFSDAGWGAFGFNAVQELNNKYGHIVDFKDDVAIPDIETTLRNYAAHEYDLIIAQGFEWGNPAVKVGKDYPNTKFVVFTGLANSTNVASIFPKQQEGTYLLGALAAMMSKTGVIGFVGGERYPNLLNIFEGYKQGARDINPNVQVLETYLDDWDNSTKGKEAALSQISDGADLLLHVADTSGHGVIQAAKEKGVYALGAISDQNKLASNTVLTSFVLDVEKAFDQAVKMVQTGNFSGQIFKPGLEAGKGALGDGIVYLAPFHSLEDKVPDDVKIKLEELKQGIINGTIIVPERH
ncbi:MAG TPA: BMP family protein [Nitrososphaeraceae archaeon]|nr:BMP family protein [Nitrososphaeraceae archaeon]